jgi:protein SCO1/2
MQYKIFPYYKIFISIIIITLILVSANYLNKGDIFSKKPPVLGTINPFELTDNNGETFGLNRLKNKISIVDFIFTRCMGPCPIMTDHMGSLYNQYSNNKNIQFVSITVDPDYDSINVLQSYAKDNSVTDNRWLFLHGDIKDIIELSEKSFMLSADDLPAMHSTKFVLVDRDAQIRGYYDGTDSQSAVTIHETINLLLEDQS